MYLIKYPGIYILSLYCSNGDENMFLWARPLHTLALFLSAGLKFVLVASGLQLFFHILINCVYLFTSTLFERTNPCMY
jgi:hypothetical protein